MNNLIAAIGDLLYNPWVPLLLLSAGVYFTCRTGFVQLRLLGESLRVVLERPQDRAGTSSFAALMVSTASRVGSGNIVGVSTAICVGGYGAVFWMWATALLGGASAFIESTLAQIYKRRDEDGSGYGGPAYYMEFPLGQRWLGILFCAALIGTYAVGYNMLAAYNLQSTFVAFPFYRPSTPFVIGLLLAALFAACIMGGAKRLSRITEWLVPVMGVLYVLVALVVTLINARHLPAVLTNIFTHAFDVDAILGGFAGSAVMQGIKRGLYSNEVGMGSAPNAAAAADVSHPVKQGLVQMLSVFIDTLLICTATALMCLSSGITPDPALQGALYVQQTLTATLGTFGPIFIAVSMSLFAFTSLIGNYYYCEGCLRFLLRRRPSPAALTAFRLAATALVFTGTLLSADLVWDTADLFQALMVLINIPAIFLLRRSALDALRDYQTQRRAGQNPTFRAADIVLAGKTDFWR